MTDSNTFPKNDIPPLLIVISGPSGVGKDTVIQHMKDRSLHFHFVVTATTRPARENEVHGKDYFFVSHDEFARMIEADELLEFAHVYNDYKGIPKFQVREALESNLDVIMRLDVQGAATIRKLYPQALLIFLTTEDEDALINRLKNRQTETHDEISMRIAMARREFNSLGDFDYVLVNRENQLDETVDIILAIITAEHHKVHPRRVSL
jgi:guanylate kinase